jgi:hypothetical protein
MCFAFLSFGGITPRARYVQRTLFTVYMQSFVEFCGLIRVTEPLSEMVCFKLVSFPRGKKIPVGFGD